MANRKRATFDVTCPCCQAVLTLDAEARAVLAHTPPPRTGPLSSLDKAVEALRGAEARRDVAFRQAAEAEKSKPDLLSRKFDVGLKRAKDSPDPPPRRYDYD